jgi:hypothetical protein
MKADAGKIVLAGAFGETPEGALFVWKDSSVEVRPMTRIILYITKGYVDYTHDFVSQFCMN